MSQDSQCVLTLYLRPFKVQVCLLLAAKMSSAFATVLDILERSIRNPLLQQPFGLVLTNNWRELSGALRDIRFTETAHCKVHC